MAQKLKRPPTLSDQAKLIRDLLWLGSKSEVIPEWWPRSDLETASGSRRVAARISDLRHYYEIESRRNNKKNEAEYRYVGKRVEHDSQ